MVRVIFNGITVKFNETMTERVLEILRRWQNSKELKLFFLDPYGIDIKRRNPAFLLLRLSLSYLLWSMYWVHIKLRDFLRIDKREKIIHHKILWFQIPVHHKILYILMVSLHIFLYSDIGKVYFLTIKSYGKVLSNREQG